VIADLTRERKIRVAWTNQASYIQNFVAYHVGAVSDYALCDPAGDGGCLIDSPEGEQFRDAVLDLRVMGCDRVFCSDASAPASLLLRRPAAPVNLSMTQTPFDQLMARWANVETFFPLQVVRIGRIDHLNDIDCLPGESGGCLINSNDPGPWVAVACDTKLCSAPSRMVSPGPCTRLDPTSCVDECGNSGSVTCTDGTWGPCRAFDNTCIGSAGGTVQSGTATLSIPPGALSSAANITISPIDPQDIAEEVRPLGPAYDFSPPGTNFAKPVILTFGMTATPPPDDDPVIYWSSGDGTWDELTTAVSGSTLIATIDHFSKGLPTSRPKDVRCRNIDPTTCGRQMDCNCAALPGETDQGQSIGGDCLSVSPSQTCRALPPQFHGGRPGDQCQGYYWTGGATDGKVRKGMFSDCLDSVMMTPCVVTLPQSKYPKSVEHIRNAQGMFGMELEIERTGAGARRRAAIGGMQAPPGDDLDEYPPAMFSYSGTADVKPIPFSDNRGSGSCIGNQLRKIPNFSKVRFNLVP
jgi:hypothetical protein